MTDRPTTEAGRGEWRRWSTAAEARSALIDELVAAVEVLPIHNINGYEWECEECHYHFARHPCRHTGVEATEDGEVDSREEPTDHRALLNRAAVLRLLEGARHG